MTAARFARQLAPPPAPRQIVAVAVYTPLSRQLVSNMAAVFPDLHGELKDLEGIPQGSINTTYRLTTTAGATWYLRVNEGKAFSALVHERDVLQALARVDLGAVTPLMALSVAGGSFFPVDVEAEDGSVRPRRWASFFPCLPGRDLGVFEVTAAHSVQVGRFLARAHQALRGFRRRLRNPHGLPVVRGWLHVLAGQRVAPEVVARLTTTIEALRKRRKPLPAGLIHGDLFVDNTKWEDATLRAVFDWEMAGRDHLLLDLAVAVCAWSFVRDERGMSLRDDVAAALVEGYLKVRPLRDSERRGFFTELRLAAVRFTASRIRDFEAPGNQGGERRYLDYRDFLARLDVIEGRGERSLRQALGVR